MTIIQREDDVQPCRDSLLKLDRSATNVAHAGLLLARYLRVAVSDVAKEHPGERQGLQTASCSAAAQARPLYDMAFDRWRVSLPADNPPRAFDVRGRLIVGLGDDNVLETGITLHHTYGVPVIPGTALKGLAAHYCDQVWGTAEAEFKRLIKYEENGRELKRAGKYFIELFGAGSDSGHVVFHDAWIDPASLTGRPDSGIVPDVTTPHHGKYYSNRQPAPTDFDDPDPVTFLSVAGRFHVAVRCDVGGKEGRKWTTLALELLAEALREWGVGGKTSSGYGRLIPPSVIAASSTPPATRAALPRPAPPPGPRHISGETVSVTRVDDPKGRGRVWFVADDGFGGIIVHGQPPSVDVGGTTTLEIAARLTGGYNFRVPMHGRPADPKRTREKLR